MTPSVFAGTTAVDEFTFCESADKQLLKRLTAHRKAFITQEDFAWIAQHGLSTVRIPIGHWLFGDVAPYQSTVEYLDNAFVWAKQYKLQILLSVHGAPGSQNGQDHSGRAGEISWHKDEAYISQSLRFVQQLAERYADAPALWGIELLNEPSIKLPKRTLKKYYQDAYEIIHSAAGSQPAIIFSDGFKPRRWKRVLREPAFTAHLDTHQYQIFDAKNKRLNAAGHLTKTSTHTRKQLAKMQKFHTTIVGEWSAALDEASLQGLNPLQKQAALTAYASAQILAYEQTAGWFYWSYKTEDSGPWNFRASVESGLLPPSFEG